MYHTNISLLNFDSSYYHKNDIKFCKDIKLNTFNAIKIKQH